MTETRANTNVSLSGLNVLLVEDEFIIAVDALEILKSLDVGQVRLSSTYDEAERLVQEEAFDLVILDININGKMSFPLGQILSGRGIPFIFASGYNLNARAIPGYNGGICVSKPYSREQLRDGLITAVAQAH